MQKKFITNLGLLLFLNLLVKPFWILGIDRGVQNLVGFESYGFYTTVLNFSFLFNILLDFGITNFNNRNIAQNKQLLSKHFSGIVLLRFILAGIYFVAIMVAGLLWGYDAGQMRLLAVVGINQFLLSFLLYLRSNISGLLMFRTDSMLSVLDRLLMIGMVGYLLTNQTTRANFQIEWFVYAQTLAYAISCLTALAVVMRKASFARLSWNVPFFLMIIKQSLPFALLTLLMATYNRIDPVLIEKILPGESGNQQVGVYASAYRLLDAINMIAYLFAVLLLPVFATLIKKKENVVPIVRLSFTLLFTFSLLVAVTAMFHAREIMGMLYPRHINETLSLFDARLEQSGFIFSLLMWGFLAISSSYVFGTLLTANGSLGLLNRVALLSVVINILLNLVLIPRLMATGSAFASLGSQAVSSLIQAWLVWKIFRFRTDRKYLLAILLFIFTVFLAAGILELTPAGWITRIAMLWLTGLAAAIGLKLLNIKRMFEILREKNYSTNT